VAAGIPGTQCLIAEYATACNPGVDSAVCSWHNAAVRGCDTYATAPLGQHPEDVWFSASGASGAASSLRWAGSPQVGLPNLLEAVLHGSGFLLFARIQLGAAPWMRC
jgi:hypothetical protein